jgi:MerR family transcriptional regulator/heat shock protein HspR
MKKTGKAAYYMISAVAQNTTSIHRRPRGRARRTPEAVAHGRQHALTGRGSRAARNDFVTTRDLGVNLAGVEIILNMRRKIEQMQGEVNEFMEYVKREMARGIDDWEQRLSTALVKSSPTDLVKSQKQ